MGLQKYLPNIELVHCTRDEIQTAITDTQWQFFRLSLKGEPTQAKLERLACWLHEHGHSRSALVQVQNYVYALKRGGQIGMDGSIQR